MSACRRRRSSAARAGASRWCSTSSTRTASARRRRAWARRSTASTSRCATPRERKPFGKPLSTNQAIQFPLVELQTQCEMLRALIHKTAWGMDTYGAFSQSDKVSMCNYWANRLCCEAADRAMQVHGGLGYSRHKPFEHIYRHHRRYRITEGAEEIQMRRVAGYLFGFMNQQAPKGVVVDELTPGPSPDRFGRDILRPPATSPRAGLCRRRGGTMSTARTVEPEPTERPGVGEGGESAAAILSPLVRALLGPDPPLRVEFWDGSHIGSSGPESVGTLHVKSRRRHQTHPVVPERTGVRPGVRRRRPRRRRRHLPGHRSAA